MTTYIWPPGGGGGSGGGISGINNVGTGSDLFTGIVGGVAQIRTLKAGLNVSFTIDPDGTLVINAVASGTGPAPYYHMITSTDVTNQYLTLPYTPADASRVVFDIAQAGGAMIYDPSGAGVNALTDYYIFGNLLKWDGKRLGVGGLTPMDAGWQIIVTYFS